MDPLNRRDPQSLGRNEVDEIFGAGMGPLFLQLVGVALALVLVVSGLSLAFSSFNLVREIIVKPESLTSYLASWERNLKSPDASAEPKPAPGSPDLPAKVAAPEKELPGTPASKPSSTIGPDTDTWLNLMNSLAEGIQSGEFARPVGAFFIFLFTLILVRIPLALIASGSRMLTGLIVKKDKAK